MRACLARCPRCCPALLLLILLTPGARMEAAPGVDRFGDPLPDGAMARLGTIRQRVTASQIAVSADGRTLVAVAAGRAVSRWDAATGRMRTHRLLPGRPRNQFWLSADGRLLAVNEDGENLAVYDTQTGVRKIQVAAPAVHGAFRADGKVLATGAVEKSRRCIHLWDLASGKERLLAKLPSYTNDLAFSPDGQRLFAAVDNHSLRCWNVESGKQVWQNEHWASHLAVSPDGRTLCSDTYQRSELHLWDADTGRRIGGGSTGERRWVGRLAFAPDGRTVFLAAYKDVLLWDVAAGKVRRRLGGAGSPFVLAPDGKTLASIHSALLRRWDVETGKPLYPDTSERGHTGAVCGVVFTPDGRHIVTAGADETIRVWDLSTQRPRTLLTGVRPRYGASITWSPDSWRPLPFSQQVLAITTDGRRLLSDAGEEQLRLSDIRTGEEVRRFDVRGADNKAWVGAARLSADSRTLWTLTYPQPEFTSTIRIENKGSLIDWDLATGRRLSTHPLEWSGDLMDFVIAPDGRTVALADGSVRDVRSGKKLLKRSNPPLSYPFAFCADGRLVAAVADGDWNALAVHELLTGRPLVRVEAAVSWYSRFTFSPDGRLLIASGRDALHVWEVSSGRQLLHLPAEGRSHPQAPGLFATCLAVAPDGRSAATGHEDGTVLLWDVTPAWRRLAERPGVTLTDAELDACWAELLKDDPRTAYATMDRLTTIPARAMRLFRKHLRPVTIDSQWLADRMAALDNADFAVREKASRDLAGIAETIEPRLRRELEQTSSAEVRSRLRRLLETTRSQVLPAETVRQLRAVAVLEHLATAEARALLRELAQGEPGDRLTGAANAALARLTAVHVP